MTPHLTPADLAAARALCDAQKPLTVIDDKATASVCISDGDTYIARSSYVWAGDAALHREALARVGRIVGLVNAVPALLAHIEAAERENERLRDEVTGATVANGILETEANRQTATIIALTERIRLLTLASEMGGAIGAENTQLRARIAELEQMLTGSGAVVEVSRG